MRTNDVIHLLARDVRPVRPLRHPVRRGMEWLAGTAVILAAMLALKVMVSGAPLVGVPASLLVPQAAAITASVTAALAAFVTIVPGMSRRVLVWPLVATMVWIAGLLAGTFQEGRVDALRVGADSEWPCVLMIALGSLLPVVGLTRLLREGAPLSPRLTLALGVLSAAGAANIGACLSQPHTSSGVLLVWHGATVLVLVVAGALAGRRVLVWPRPGL